MVKHPDQTKKLHQNLLKMIGIMFVFGGVVRIFANQTLFNVFGMQDLWSTHAYFIYIYKVLGAFVVFTGVLFFKISGHPENNPDLLGAVKWGLLIIGTTMLITGVYVSLPFVFYAPDFGFCYTVSVYLTILIRNFKK